VEWNSTINKQLYHAFQEACKTYNIDLISVDLSQRLDGMLTGKSAYAAVGCVSILHLICLICNHIMVRTSIFPVIVK